MVVSSIHTLAPGEIGRHGRPRFTLFAVRQTSYIFVNFKSWAAASTAIQILEARWSARPPLDDDNITTVASLLGDSHPLDRPNFPPMGYPRRGGRFDFVGKRWRWLIATAQKQLARLRAMATIPRSRTT